MSGNPIPVPDLWDLVEVVWLMFGYVACLWVPVVFLG